ncbi:5-(carboxyamino)imidazole ribonucleotide synthase [Treponema sp. J25]|uniref:5-(carboxyamino)imidazole ribonucleotide synthase n=1 Tax=Treponema sp. J25 TaxID=2094121 RepID=UPI0010448024|nr:5-(carboxyamino)imidazole ribonucleotide synthase [Treponema sp. J25]TCW60582.1 5-(carboxyamino)imidazole ribonucleotide synthase [Treponema sp. J25]
MEQYWSSSFKLGIIAGGQLAKMLIQVANQWDIATWVLDPDPACPASRTCTHLVRGDRHNPQEVLAFGRQVDLLTFEIESIEITALESLSREGRPILPDPAILRIIQDKGLQKQFYVSRGFPTGKFQLVENANQVRALVEQGKVHLPFVQKLRTGGYDGRGVLVIRRPEDLQQLFDAPSVVEEYIPIAKELAVIAARNTSGQVRPFPAVEMEFHPEANLVEHILCPADIDPRIEKEAEQIACDLAAACNLVGLLAVEFFLDTQGRLWINEVAPRPHNSGHLTIEACATSQYEQHLRAILGLPLMTTRLIQSAAMINLIGAEGFAGPVRYRGLEKALAIEGVKVHIYGKQETRPCRKMGHITIVGSTREEVIAKSRMVQNLVRVEA